MSADPFDLTEYLQFERDIEAIRRRGGRVTSWREREPELAGGHEYAMWEDVGEEIERGDS